MLLEVVENWTTREQVKTSRGKFYGIAIGPNSDEGRVEVNGTVLQSGRILALPSSGDGYTIRRETGVKCLSTDSSLTFLQAVKRLELCLFTSPEELSVEVARANGRYYTLASVAMAGNGVAVRCLTVPFVGRRQAQIDIAMYVSDTFAYQCYGRRYSKASKAVVQRLLLDATTAAGAPTSNVQFVVGGSDVAETWDELAIDVAGTAGNPNAIVDVDVETIGETGVR